MAKITVSFGIAFILLGLISYLVSNMSSITALIPAIFGLVFIVLGLLATRNIARKLLMHIAMVLALLAIISNFSSILKFYELLIGIEPERIVAVVGRFIMVFLSIIYLGFGINSFIQARRKRK